ncbi:hypothetical protein CP971_22960 [Streptomyces viridifaciens]|nr:hypothetical protein CP971_22960 [Streptomyces viridifaciens]
MIRSLRAPRSGRVGGGGVGAGRGCGSGGSGGCGGGGGCGGRVGCGCCRCLRWDSNSWSSSLSWRQRAPRPSRRVRAWASCRSRSPSGRRRPGAARIASFSRRSRWPA